MATPSFDRCLPWGNVNDHSEPSMKCITVKVRYVVRSIIVFLKEVYVHNARQFVQAAAAKSARTGNTVS
jgi:hypothetical protein